MKDASENKNSEMTEEIVAFISHSSKDAEKAQQVADSLEKKGLRCWIAPRNIRPGKEYGEEIIYGIRDCRCLVLLLSEAANQSVHVRNEVERAVSYGKAVFPIRIEEVLPSPALELSVSSVHWISAWTGNLLDHVEDLANTLQNPDNIKHGVGITAPSMMTRIKRFIRSNFLSLIILILLLGAGYYVYSFIQAKGGGGNTQVTLPMSEFSQSDLAFRGTATSSSSTGQVSSFRYMLMFGPSNQKGQQTLRNVQYRIDLADGQHYTSQSTGGVASFNVESMTLLHSVSLTIFDANDEQFGPFAYSLNDINQNLQQQSKVKGNIKFQKHLVQWKQKVASKRLFDQCSRVFDPGISFCKIMSHDFSGTLQDMVQRIDVQVADSDMTFVIEPEKVSSNGLGVTLDNSGDITKPFYIFPFPLSALQYQVTFADGEQSAMLSYDRNPRFDAETKNKMFKFMSDKEEAPDVYAILDINNKRWDPSAYSTRIALIPFVSNEVVSIQWRSSLHSEENFEQQTFNQTIYWRSNSDTKLFGDIGSSSKLFIRYRNSSGETKEFAYSPDWQGWQLN